MKITTYSLLALLTALPCVSRASIASKLNDLEDCRVAITNAIVAKGGTASGALTNAAAEIAALPSGVQFEFGYTNGSPTDANFLLKCISSLAFYSDLSLKDVESKAVALVGFNTFRDCFNITNVNFQNCLETSSDSFWKIGNNTEGVNIFLPSLKKLNRYTFEQCYKLVVVDIPNVTDIIEVNAFDSANASSYGGTKVYFTNQTYSATEPWSNLPWGGGGNIWFYFANGIVKKIDGVWILTTE